MQIHNAFQSLVRNTKLLTLTAMLIAASANLHATIAGIAGFTFTQPVLGTYEYTLTLTNTGTTTIGTFWLGWIPGAGFMPDAPTNVQSPSGWSPTLTNGNAAIQWTTASSLLAPGTSLPGFIFDSTMTPAQFEGPFPGPGLGAGDPVDTFFVYIAAPLADPGFQGSATAPAAPEPASWAVILIGFAGLAVLKLRRRPS
jgi:hypothetical protein